MENAIGETLILFTIDALQRMKRTRVSWENGFNGQPNNFSQPSGIHQEAQQISLFPVFWP